MSDQDLFTLAEIRAALGVDEKVMLSELLAKTREIKRDAERYEKVRKLTPREISGLWLKGLRSNRSFDELVDAFVITHEKEENT